MEEERDKDELTITLLPDQKPIINMCITAYISCGIHSTAISFEIP